MTDFRIDDWSAANSALGGIRDKSTGISFDRRSRLSRRVLDALYEQNPIAARVVDRLVDDSLRGGWRLKNVLTTTGEAYTELDPIYKRLDDLAPPDENLNDVISRAAKWSRLYGGALILLPTVEHDEHGHTRGPEQPLIKPQQLHPLAVIPAHDAIPDTYDAAFGSKTFMQALSYQLVTFGETLTVHSSRVVRLEPIELPPEALQHSATRWGPSVLDRLFDALSQAGASRKHAVGMMFLASLLFVKIHSLRNALTVPGERDKAVKFLQEVQKNLSAMGLLALDKEDEIGSVSLTQTGSHELIGKADDYVAASGDMPREILFNESPAGLNAGELSGPQEIWFANCQAYQEKRLTPAINRILRVAFLAWDLPIASWEIKWAPLWTKSDDKAADTNLKNAQADRAYYDMGALGPDEIRRARFVDQNAGTIEIAPADATAEPLDLSGPPTDGDVTAQVQAMAPADAPTEPAKEALNGAQIASLIAIIEKTQAGLIPRDAAIEIVRASFPSQFTNAERLLGSAGLTPPPALPGAPGAVVAAPDAAGDPAAPAPSTDPVPADLLSPRDAAARFGLPTRAITRQIEKRGLRYWGIGSHQRVSLAEVAELARSHEAPAAEEDPAEDPEAELGGPQ